MSALFLEAGALAEEFIVAETGSSLLGAVAKTATNTAILQGAEFLTKKAVDNIYGEGTFENLERDVNDFYQSGKDLVGEVGALMYDIKGYNDKDFTGISEKQLKGLKEAREKFNENKFVKPYVQGAAEFAKDFAHIYSGTEVSTGNFEGSGSGLRGIENNKSNVSKILNTLSRVNPFYAYLASKVSDKLTDFFAPDDPGYLKVASTYNGVGLYDRNMILEDLGAGNYEFSIIDEAGGRVVWKFPEYNTYTVVPPLYGTWTGINSPNNSLCLSGTVNGVAVQSYLDKIAFMHDVGYHDLGSFNEFSDYQLISRALYGKENGLFIFPGEAAAANVAISYFSTLGKLMRKMFGPGAEAGGVQGPSGVVEKSIVAEAVSEISGVEVSEDIIKTELVDAVRSIKTSYGSETVGTGNFALRTALDNLEVQIN